MSYLEKIGEGYDKGAPKPKKTKSSFFSFLGVSQYKVAESQDGSYARLEEEITNLLG